MSNSKQNNPTPGKYFGLACFTLAMALLLCLSGCSPKMYPTLPPETVTIKDSISTKVEDTVDIVRDTLNFYLPAQKAERETCDTTSHLENDYAVSDASIDKDGVLHHSLSTKTETPLNVPYTKENRNHKETNTEIVEKPVPYPVPYPVEKEVPATLSRWQMFRMTMGDIALFAIAILGIFLVVKKVLLKR